MFGADGPWLGAPGFRSDRERCTPDVGIVGFSDSNEDFTLEVVDIVR